MITYLIRFIPLLTIWWLPMITRFYLIPQIFHPQNFGSMPWEAPSTLVTNIVYYGIVYLGIIISFIYSSELNSLNVCGKRNLFLSIKRSIWSVIGYILSSLLSLGSGAMLGPVYKLVALFFPFARVITDHLIVALGTTFFTSLGMDSVMEEVCQVSDDGDIEFDKIVEVGELDGLDKYLGGNMSGNVQGNIFGEKILNSQFHDKGLKIEKKAKEGGVYYIYEKTSGYALQYVRGRRDVTLSRLNPHLPSQKFKYRNGKFESIESRGKYIGLTGRSEFEKVVFGDKSLKYRDIRYVWNKNYGYGDLFLNYQLYNPQRRRDKPILIIYDKKRLTSVGYERVKKNDGIRGSTHNEWYLVRALK